MFTMWEGINLVDIIQYHFISVIYNLHVPWQKPINFLCVLCVYVCFFNFVSATFNHLQTGGPEVEALYTFHLEFPGTYWL
jgi:hypothetical protein